MAKTLENMNAEELVEYNYGLEKDLQELREKRQRVHRLLTLELVREGKATPKLKDALEDEELMAAYKQGDQARRQQAEENGQQTASLEQAEEENE